MKIELDENAFWLGICIAIFVSIIAIVTIACIADYKDNENAFKYGYERVILPGSSQSHWVKVKQL